MLKLVYPKSVYRSRKQPVSIPDSKNYYAPNELLKYQKIRLEKGTKEKLFDIGIVYLEDLGISQVRYQKLSLVYNRDHFWNFLFLKFLLRIRLTLDQIKFSFVVHLIETMNWPSSIAWLMNSLKNSREGGKDLEVPFPFSRVVFC